MQKGLKMCNVPDSLTRYEIEQDKNAEEYNYAFGELEERTADLLAEIAGIAKGVEVRYGFDMKEALKELFTEVA